jgi:hypothetical protein
MAFTAPIYAKIMDTQQIFVHISRAELYPNRTKTEKIGRMLMCGSKYSMTFNAPSLSSTEFNKNLS